MIWQRYPSIRVLICFVAAIILYPILSLPQDWIIAIFSTSFLVLLLIQFFPKINKRIGVFGFGFLLKMVLVFFMFLVQSFQDIKNQKGHFLKDTFSPSYHHFKILNDPQEKEKVFSAEAICLSMLHGESSDIKGKVLLYFEKDSLKPPPNFGDKLIWNGQLNEVSGPKNPEEFNYKKHLEAKEIFVQAYLKSDTWFLQDSNKTKSLKSISLNVRKGLLAKIDQWTVSKEVKDISKALLLGYKNDLEKNLRNSYSNTGVAHILAVSGLHVGMLYILLSYALTFLLAIPHGEATRTVILLAALWFYAFLTGLSPSVLRSVCMFSFVAFGGFFGREVSIYNTLSASAILLLLLNPQLVYNLGFQLSYSAVFFIVWMQKYLSSLWTPKFWLPKKIWSICSVSISAQVGTSLLSIYYFHQFPTYFLFSNILVIPLITIIMYTGLAVLVLDVLGIAISYLLNIYAWLIEIMNYSIRYLEKIPGSKISSLHLSKLDLLLAYLFLLLILCWFFYGKRWRIQLSMSFLALFLVVQLFEKWTISKSEKMILFSVANNWVLGIQEGNKFCLMANSDFWENEKEFQYKVEPYLISQNILELNRLDIEGNFKSSTVSKASDFLNTKHGLFWKIPTKAASAPTADYWIINQKVWPPEKWEGKPKMVFINSRLANSLQIKWREWSSKNEIAIWDLNQKGFYVNSSF